MEQTKNAIVQVSHILEIEERSQLHSTLEMRVSLLKFGASLWVPDSAQHTP